LILLAGCTPHKEAETLKNEGLKRIASANSTIKELNESFAINLNPLNETTTAAERAGTYDWSKMTEAQRRKVKAKLLAHNENVTRILEITRDKDVMLVGDSTALKRSGEAAWQYYLSLEKFAKRHVSK